MSWDPYLDNLIARSKDGTGAEHVDKAVIIGLQDGGAAWTTAAHKNAMKPSADETKKISQCLKDRKFDVFMASGVFLEGVKYQFLRQEDKTVYAKKKDCGSVTIQASKTAIVIAHCPDGKQQGMANKAVDGIVEYLESVGI